MHYLRDRGGLMKLTRCKKIFLIIALTAFVVLLFSSNTAFGAINKEYSTTDSVPDTALDEAFDDSTLLELLAKLIYAVGRFLEWILGTIFKLLTGSSDFPWADKIVFNAVPLLDVNFINPDSGSFVGQDIIKEVLKNLYATILTLAASFFGIVVLITAIKLVISTIASDKAKYKQAIVDWVVGFVMLFCIHYAISFIFYLNEQLVVVASNIVTANLIEYEDKIVKVQQSELAKELIEDARSKISADEVKILEDNSAILTSWMNALASNDTSKGMQELLMKDFRWYGVDTAINQTKQYQNLSKIILWATQNNVSVQELNNIKNNLKYDIDGTRAISKEDYDKIFTTDEIRTWFATEAQTNPTDYYCWDGEDLLSRFQVTQQDQESFYSDRPGYVCVDSPVKYYLETTTFYWEPVINDLITIKAASATSGGNSSSGNAKRILADLATYFRYNSYTKERRTTNVTALKDGNAQIQNMIMYAILVAQSLILFIAYIKRLFYVIILAMMAPVVVVFDFFQKFGK